MRSIKIGTRGSILALKQCYEVLAELQTTYWQVKQEILKVSIQPIRTEGDKKQGTPEAASLTKKAWVDEIENALINKEIDVAIHSGKDLPNEIINGTKLISVSQRLYPFDVFIGKKTDNGRTNFRDLKKGSVIGTASIRRRRFILASNSDLKIVDHRGNVNTRILKLDSDETLSGIVLAEAGIVRLGLTVNYERLPIETIVPSRNQGILVAQIREDDIITEEILSLILNEQTEKEFQTERKTSTLLNSDCATCVGIFAYHDKNKILNLHIKAISSKNETVENISVHNGSQSLDKFVKHSIETVLRMGIKDIMNN